ncbi:MAG: phosphoheptose isomerase [Bacteroidetes bacterium GWE2_29_8]|nr:MAG: phosphoheptose isomerase [Bacteroidetes bacterium GWE2_29_8]OFY17624.1 MAG: phosphoheptose isomerase [Bacteroidetes bacterium GWF2_29_10]
MLIENIIQESIDIRNKILNDKDFINLINEVSSAIVDSYKKGGKVLLCGNGGSASDAQHLAAELSGRFAFDRPPLAAEALHVNSSYMTAVANDYSFDVVYARLLSAIGNKGDVLIGISTSGNSVNIINALEVGNKKGLITIGFTSEAGDKMEEYCKYTFKVPSTNTARVQEVHIMIGHIICQIVEKTIFHDWSSK